MEPVSLDHESAEWVRELTAKGEGHDRAVARLHALLLQIARGEAERRRTSLPARGIEELDELCIQATNDALVALLAKLDVYRGAARFTTWAAKFVILETSSVLRRHAWRQRKVELDDTVWDRLPDAAPSAVQALQSEELGAALGRAVREALTPRQRLIFQCVTIDDVPIDVLAERLGTTRGAIYKTLHDARRKLRNALVTAGHEEALA